MNNTMRFLFCTFISVSPCSNVPTNATDGDIRENIVELPRALLHDRLIDVYGVKRKGTTCIPVVAK